MTYDIAIAYRCYPKISKKPFQWSDDKLSMICWWLESLLRCTQDLKVKLYIIDDGCPIERQKDIKKYIESVDFEYITTPSIGNAGTFKKQVELLSHQKDAAFVYFAEDDYIYTDKGFSEWIQLLKNNKADFVTLFDHRGHYTAYHHSIQHHYIIDDTHQRIWKTLPSTCMTFMTSKTILLETQQYLLKYSAWVRDYPLRLWLTKYNIFRWIDIDRSYKDKLLYTIKIPATRLHLGMLWIKCWKQVLFGKKYRLYCPVPSIATHLESEDRAPLVDRIQ